MRGSEHCVAISVTTMLILVLSIATIVMSIFYQQTKINNEKREFYVYAIFFVIYLIGTCLSIQKLHKVTRTDPGFIPNKKVLGDSIMSINSLNKLKDENRKHYVQYQNEEELRETFKTNMNETMIFDKQDDSIHKYYSTKKFKYHYVV